MARLRFRGRRTTVPKEIQQQPKHFTMARLKSFTNFVAVQTGVIVPLYRHPLSDYIPRVWAPLLNAIRKYPIVHFTIVIHPTFKSDGSLDAPTAKYRRALGYIQEFPNVTVVGYIDAGFGKRNLKQLLSDVERLWGWREKFNYFGDNGSGPRGLDGVFIDAVGGEQQHIRALEELCKDVKSRRWRAGKSGYVVLNTKGPPRHYFYDLADVVIVFEGAYHSFVNPPILKYSAYEYLPNADPNHGLKLKLPQPSDDLPSWQFGVIINGLLPKSTKNTKLHEMRELVYDLVQIKRVSAIFITDVEEKDADGNKNWSLVWDEFISMLADAKMRASTLY